MSINLLEFDDVLQTYRLASAITYHDAWYIRGREINSVDVPAGGEALVYNAGTGQWEYAFAGGGVPAAHAATHAPGAIDAIATAAPAATCLDAASAEGVAASFARSDHVHASNTAPVMVTRAASAVGTSGAPARADHKHDISTAAPGATSVGTTSSVGTASSMARSDHRHQSNTAPADVTKDVAAIGTSGEPARADHKHNVTTAAPPALASGDVVAEGTATTLARSDHLHGPPLQEVVTLTNGTGAASVLGQVVQIYGSGADATFITATANPRATVGLAGFACGAVLDDAVADGDPCRVVVSGLAQVLVEIGMRGEPLTAHESIDGSGAGIGYSATSPRYAQGLGVLRENAPAGGGLTWCILQVQHDISILITAAA